MYIYIKLKLSSWLISMPYSSPTEPPERDLVPGSEVARFTVIYFAYESLYLTFCSLKILQMWLCIFNFRKLVRAYFARPSA